MNQQGRTGLIIGVVVVVLVLGLIGIATYLRSNQQAAPAENGDVVTLPTTTPPGPETNTKVYRASYVTGFEGENTTVSYELPYDASKFAVAASDQGAATINIVEGNRTHTISIFNNVGAGFADSREAYEGTNGSNFCTGCNEITANFQPLAGSDIKVWQSATREVIVYKHEPGFVIIKLERPSDAVRALARGLKLSTTPGGTIGDTKNTTVFLHLVKNATNSCTDTVKVSRVVPLTQAPATAALNLLLAEGNYPAGSKLNSLRVTGGVAYADFNSATESGGGSCAMSARTTQIRKTLLEFPTVTKVVITVNGAAEDLSFQP